MKKILYILSIILFISCEEVIDVPLDTEKPRLVIDASILWAKGTTGNEQKIKLTTTADFYSNIIPKVSGAIVQIKNSTNSIFNFVETPNTGEYICSNFQPIIGENYTLIIQYQGDIYTATEKLIATPVITHVTQTKVTGFTGDAYQIKFFYQDNGSETNYYLTSIKHSSIISPSITALKDEFFQGNQMFDFFESDKIDPGDELFMTLQGINLQYFDYMSKLINISGGSGAGPFATPSATVKGNIINQSNAANYPLGYFHLSEMDSRTYIVE